MWRAGGRWLGRDARAGQAQPEPARAHVRSPWRYGFHATLTAPMSLAPGVDEAQWLRAVAALAARQQPFVIPPLTVAMLDDFLALRPCTEIAATHPLRLLADACVTSLDGLRAPLAEAERERRMRPHFSARQQELVLRHGYAHVLDEWRFHLTLSDGLASVPADEVERMTAAARAEFADALQVPMVCDALSLFTEPAPGAPFVLTHRIALGPASGRGGAQQLAP